MFSHNNTLLKITNKKRLSTERRTMNSSFGKSAGFSTLKTQVAGHHRACPSATLDKENIKLP